MSGRSGTRRRSCATICSAALLFAASACTYEHWQRGDGRTAATLEFPSASPLYDEPPKLLSGATPIYPPEELLNGEVGQATVAFTIDENGLPQNVRLAKASAPNFGISFVDAVRGWRFAPATRRGRAVAVPVVRTFYFCMTGRHDDCRDTVAVAPAAEAHP